MPKKPTKKTSKKKAPGKPLARRNPPKKKAAPKRRARRNPPKAAPRRRKSRARRNPPTVLSGTFARKALGLIAGGVAAVALTAMAQRVVDDPKADKTVAIIVPAVTAIAAMQVGGELGANMAAGALGVVGAAVAGTVADAVQTSQAAALPALPKRNPVRLGRINPPGIAYLNPPPSSGFADPLRDPRAAFGA